jgi:ectoine hydroxylase-related dioxygenase (phytanoyl-CoA dioxygenase family)
MNLHWRRYHYDEFLSPEGYGTAMLALAPCTVANGCLRVIKGSHRLGRLEHTQHGSQLQAEPVRLAEVLARCGLGAELEEVECELNPGDIIHWHANTLHCSAPNLDPAMASRWSLIFGWALETNKVMVAPDPTHEFVALRDSEVAVVIDRYERGVQAAAALRDAGADGGGGGDGARAGGANVAKL